MNGKLLFQHRRNGVQEFLLVPRRRVNHQMGGQTRFADHFRQADRAPIALSQPSDSAGRDWLDAVRRHNAPGLALGDGSSPLYNLRHARGDSRVNDRALPFQIAAELARKSERGGANPKQPHALSRVTMSYYGR